MEKFFLYFFLPLVTSCFGPVVSVGCWFWWCWNCLVRFVVTDTAQGCFDCKRGCSFMKNSLWFGSIRLIGTRRANSAQFGEFGSIRLLSVQFGWIRLHSARLFCLVIFPLPAEGFPLNRPQKVTFETRFLVFPLFLNFRRPKK